MKTGNRVWAEINLDAVRENYEAIRRTLSEETKIMAVVKADGYGHGALSIAKMLQDYDYIWGFGVATIEEATSLRVGGIYKPILILGFVFESDYHTLVKNDIIPTIFTLEMAESLSKEAMAADKVQRVHIKVDTGMGRIGFADTEAAVEIIKQIAALPGIALEGIFTHFAKADEVDQSDANVQLERYSRFVKRLEDENICIALKHCSNSAAAIQMPAANMDMVRVGIAGYGIYPSQDVSREKVHLKPVMELKSHVVFVKEVSAGTPISYNGTHITSRTTTVATIPVGYADGYPRSLSGKGEVLIRGKRAAVLGRICMDQMLVDVTDIPGVHEMDEVVLVGNSGEDMISVDELGEDSGRFPYEFVCGIGKRVPRIIKK